MNQAASHSSCALSVRAATCLAFLTAFTLASACASLGRASQGDAVASARSTVCGTAAGSDSSCVVRSVERTRDGYRVVIDRRPPAGNDRVAVTVRHGAIGSRAIEVAPVDTTARPTSP